MDFSPNLFTGYDKYIINFVTFPAKTDQQTQTHEGGGGEEANTGDE